MKTDLGGMMYWSQLLLMHLSFQFIPGLALQPGGSDDGTGTLASFNHPEFLCWKGNTLLVSDKYNDLLRKISPTAVVSTVETDVDLIEPLACAVDPNSGLIYVLEDDIENSIYQITGVDSTSGAVTEILANGQGEGFLQEPRNLVIDGNGVLWVVDAGVLYKVLLDKYLLTKGENQLQVEYKNSVTQTTGLYQLFPVSKNGDEFLSIVFDDSGIMYGLLSGKNQLVVINPDTGTFTVLAGSADAAGFKDGQGTLALFHFNGGLCQLVCDSSGNIYVADSDNHAVRKITPGGLVTTVAGKGTSGFTNGVGTNAAFYYPRGLAVTSSGNLYVSDTNNNVIRLTTPDGSTATFAGTIPPPTAAPVSSSSSSKEKAKGKAKVPETSKAPKESKKVKTKAPVLEVAKPGKVKAPKAAKAKDDKGTKGVAKSGAQPKAAKSGKVAKAGVA